MEDEDGFASLLEKYSQYLTDAPNKSDLLQLGKRLFGSRDESNIKTESLEILTEKEAELSATAETTETTRRRSSSSDRSFLSRRSSLTQSLSPDQISTEISTLQHTGDELAATKESLELRKSQLIREYDELMQTSLDQKKNWDLELKNLTNELKQYMIGNTSRPSLILPVMQELQQMNDQIIDKVHGFQKARRDALAHCERSALDIYKPRMEALLAKIYEDPDRVKERLEEYTTEVEEQLAKSEAELRQESEKNDRLQTETKQLEKRVSGEKEDISKMNKELAKLGQQIAIMGDIASQEMAALKTQYQTLLSNKIYEDPMKPSEAPTELPPVDEVIDQERNMLTEKIHSGMRYLWD